MPRQESADNWTLVQPQTNARISRTADFRAVFRIEGWRQPNLLSMKRLTLPRPPAVSPAPGRARSSRLLLGRELDMGLQVPPALMEMQRICDGAHPRTPPSPERWPVARSPRYGPGRALRVGPYRGTPDDNANPGATQSVAEAAGCGRAARQVKFPVTARRASVWPPRSAPLRHRD